MPQPKKLKLKVLWRPTRTSITNTKNRCPFHHRGYWLQLWASAPGKLWLSVSISLSSFGAAVCPVTSVLMDLSIIVDFSCCVFFCIIMRLELMTSRLFICQTRNQKSYLKILCQVARFSLLPQSRPLEHPRRKWYESCNLKKKKKLLGIKEEWKRRENFKINITIILESLNSAFRIISL